jgi:hypothetical protein
MKAEFVYLQEDVNEIILDHHNKTWGNFAKKGVWVARSDYRGVTVLLEEKEESDDRETDGV